MKDKKVTIQAEKCMKCSKCSRVCPMQINVHKEARENNGQVVNRDCLKCGYCVENCPANALDFEENAKKEIPDYPVYNSRIKKVEKLAPEIKEFTLEFEEPVDLEAGQFLLLKVDEERDIHRAYSISSILSDKEVRIIIKKISDGLASPAIFELEEGDEIEIEPREGYLSLGNEKKVCFVAAGIGITPFISLTKEALKKGKEVTLLHSAKYKKELIYRDYFEELQDKYDKFEYIPSVTREKGQEVREGRVTSHLPKMDFSNHHFYVCGQPAMAESTEDIIKENFDKCEIHKESF